MRAEHINPFVRSVVRTFETMLSCPVERGALTLANPETRLYDVSGIIGLSGMAVGTVVLSFSREVALKAASALLMMEATEINPDVIDAVGELANMVAGSAKAELEEYHMSVSLPNVITGGDHQIRFPSEISPICVPFTCAWGPFKLEVGLSPVEEPVTV